MGLFGGIAAGIGANAIRRSEFAKKHPLLGDVTAGGLTMLGALSPYEQGGRVTARQPAVLHGGEYVLPKGIKPTKAQMKAVGKRKAMAKKMMKAKPVRKARKPAPKKRMPQRKNGGGVKGTKPQVIPVVFA